MRTWFFVLLVVFATACGGGGEPRDGRIGPEGGTLVGPDGVTLDVPPGAVAEPTTFRITRLDAAPAVDPVATPVGAAYRFEPANVTFARDLRITMPVPSAGTGPLLALRRPDGAAEWLPIGGASETAGEVVVFTRHFSLVRLARIVTALSACFDLTTCDGACTLDATGFPTGCSGGCMADATGTSSGIACTSLPVDATTNPVGTVFECTCTGPSGMGRLPLRVDAVVAAFMPQQAMYALASHCGLMCQMPDAGLDAGATDVGVDTGLSDAGGVDADTTDGGTVATVGDATWITGSPMPAAVATRTGSAIVHDALATAGSVFVLFENSGGTLETAPYDGVGGFTQRAVFSGPRPPASCLSASGSHVYWAVPNQPLGNDGVIERIHATSFAVENAVYTGIVNAADLVVTPSRVLYLQGDTFGATRVYSFTPDLVSNTFRDTSGNAFIASDGTSVYFGMRNATTTLPMDVLRYPLDLTGAATPLFTAGATGPLDEMYVRAVDATHVYFLAGGYLGSQNLRLYRAPTAGGAPTLLASLTPGLTVADVEVTADTIWFSGQVGGEPGAFVATLDRANPAGVTPVARFPEVPQLAVDGNQVFAVTSAALHRLAP